MRRFFLFAVLWAALFGPGHVLAACPMAAVDHGAHAPCHPVGDHTTPNVVDHGHDCCAWVSPSSGSGKFFTQKNGGPVGEVALPFVAVPDFAGWDTRPLIRPPPPVRTSRYVPAAVGSNTFLRTSRLRL